MPSLKAREVLEVLFAAGFKKLRTSGSHIRLKKGKRLVTVAYHSKTTVPKGTLSSIIRQSGLTRKKFLEILKKRK
ncbi:MAG: type II toxin-antitoxin system HicA family toxin [Candidatus Paceibacterota bacterium]